MNPQDDFRDDINNTEADKAVLVHINFESQTVCTEDLEEFGELVSAAGVEPMQLITSSRQKPDAKYFIGTGKLDEIRQIVEEEKVPLIIFNHALSPGQVRNLERGLKCRVIDRTELILDIFAQRARTFEGKLQVELAQLQHLSTRLVRGWTHLERQKGGIGLRGPGETQLETDRRLLRLRIRYILKRLDKVRKQREQSRRARKRASCPTIALVGYTNAGKSTLFNALSGADVFASKQLFATLDPTLRQLKLPELGRVVIADTVGFVRHLPHDLVEAFKATLEETQDADLLLHVVDASDENRHDKMAEVRDVLETVGAGKVPSLVVYNKIDAIDGAVPRIDYNDQEQPVRVWCSAIDQAGMAELHDAIKKCLVEDMVEESLCLEYSQGRLRNALYEKEAVIAEHIDEMGRYVLDVRMPRREYNILMQRFKEVRT